LIINGGDIMAISKAREYQLLPDKRINRNLIKHRTKQFQHLVDRLLLVCDEMRGVLSYVNSEVSENWYKTIRGTILGMLLVRCMIYQMNPVHYKYRGDLIFYANYSIIKNYLQRIIKVLICNYGLEDKYYKLFVPKQKLYQLSELFYDSMYDDSLKMVIHYHKLHPKEDDE